MKGVFQTPLSPVLHQALLAHGTWHMALWEYSYLYEGHKALYHLMHNKEAIPCRTACFKYLCHIMNNQHDGAAALTTVRVLKSILHSVLFLCSY